MAPILSICIPTYNRAGYLYFTLKSIVEQKIFQETNDIQIVISDNCSSDLTERISKIFTDKYPDKIIYNKNQENIGDNNFKHVLSLGTGEVLKLHNDNFSIVDGALDEIVELIKSFRANGLCIDTTSTPSPQPSPLKGEGAHCNSDLICHRAEKPTIFFANGNSPLNKDSMCKDLNEFLTAASYLTTWIAACSFWREDFEKLEDFARNVHTNLSQTDIVFDMSASGKPFYVYNKIVFEGLGVLKKGGYNIAKIFGKNYLSFLKVHMANGKLDKKVYENEKKRLLLNHIIPMRFSNSRRETGWVFVNDGFWRHLIQDYWHNPYFYFSIFKILRLILDAEINLIGKKLNKNSYQKYWKKRNLHNDTTITKNVDVTKVYVGKNVKGKISADFSENQREILIIDDNVILQENVHFSFDDELILVLE